jgi:Ca-activated chloride channel family protein
MIGDFHFIRPWWLVALAPLGLLVWATYRRQSAAQTWRGIIAPHLLPHLLIGESQSAHATPLLLLSIGWLLAVIAIAGPTWQREPAPFADDTAALAIVVKVTPSMMTEDVPPSRLARAVEKIHDLLAARGNAKSSLIAYAGTAHVVMPETTDAGIIDTFAQALDPKVMPGDGDAAADAMRLAEQSIAQAGSILWLADSVAQEQVAALVAWRQTSKIPVRLLPPLADGAELDAISNAATAVDANVIRLTADDTDISAVARAAMFSTAVSGGKSDRWQEAGYWITPLLAVVVLAFFRKGWRVQGGDR